MTVALSTSAHVEGLTYRLTVNGVRDRAPNPNTILPNSSATYSFSAELVISNVSVSSGRPYQLVENLNNGLFTWRRLTIIAS